MASISPMSGGTPPQVLPKTLRRDYGHLLEDCIKHPNNITSIRDLPALKFMHQKIHERIHTLEGTQAVSKLYQDFLVLSESVDNQLINMEKAHIQQNNASVDQMLKYLNGLENKNQWGLTPDLLDEWRSIFSSCKIVITQEDMTDIIEEKSSRLTEAKLVFSLVLELFAKEEDSFTKVEPTDALAKPTDAVAKPTELAKPSGEPAKIEAPDRPEDVQRMIRTLRIIDLDSIEDYIHDPTQKNETATFTTLTNQPTTIDGEVKYKIGEGTYGLIGQHEALTQNVDSKKVSEFIHTFYVSKRDIGQGNTESEYKILKQLWSELSVEERKHVVPLIAASLTKQTPLGELTFEALYTIKFDSDLQAGIKSLPIDAKLEISRDVLKSLDVLIEHGYVLADIRLKNMLYKFDEATLHYIGILSDYGELTNFKDILREPTIKKLGQLISSLGVWNPSDLPFADYIKMVNELTSIFHQLDELLNHINKINYNLIPENKLGELIDNISLELDSISQRLSSSLTNLHKLMKFSVASSLYRFITQKSPFPEAPASAFNYKPEHFKELPTLYIDPHIDHEPTQRYFLERSGCDPDLTSQLLNALNQPLTRPTPKKQSTLTPSQKKLLADLALNQLERLVDEDRYPVIGDNVFTLVENNRRFNLQVANSLTLPEVPTEEELSEFLEQLQLWNTSNLDFKEFADIKRDLTTLIYQYPDLSTKEVRDLTEDIKFKLKELEVFNGAVTLFKFLTGKLPYKQQPIQTIDGTTTALAIDEAGYPDQQIRMLTQAGYTGPFADRLVALIEPKGDHL